MLSRITTLLFPPIPQESQALAKHWLLVSTGKVKSFLPLPPEVEFETTRSGIEELRAALDEIDRRLTTLEGKIRGTTCNLDGLVDRLRDVTTKEQS